MSNGWKKSISLVLAVAMVAGFGLSAAPAGAAWSQIWNDVIQPALQVFVHEEIHDIIPDVAKQIAMRKWQQMVMKLVAKHGGYIWNYGEYIYGSGNNAAAQYWRAFLQNCANIDPTVSLKIKATAVDQTAQYDWCPVRINVRGVKIQEDIDLSDDLGWNDFYDLVDNNVFKQYEHVSENVEKARKAAQETAFMKTISTGVKPADEEIDMECLKDGPLPPERLEECRRVKIPVQSFLDLLNAATGGVATATANTKSQVATALTYMVLSQMTDWTLDKFGGKYADYFR